MKMESCIVEGLETGSMELELNIIGNEVPYMCCNGRGMMCSLGVRVEGQ